MGLHLDLQTLKKHGSKYEVWLKEVASKAGRAVLQGILYGILQGILQRHTGRHYRALRKALELGRVLQGSLQGGEATPSKQGVAAAVGSALNRKPAPRS